MHRLPAETERLTVRRAGLTGRCRSRRPRRPAQPRTRLRETLPAAAPRCPAISRRCQRSSVAGVTKSVGPRDRGSSRDRAASTTRSAGSSLGRATCRRSTATWWRRTSRSTSSAPSSRASWVSICNTWRNSRVTNDALMTSEPDSRRKASPRKDAHVRPPASICEPHKCSRAVVKSPAATATSPSRSFLADRSPQPAGVAGVGGGQPLRRVQTGLVALSGSAKVPGCGRDVPEGRAWMTAPVLPPRARRTCRRVARFDAC